MRAVAQQTATELPRLPGVIPTPRCALDAGALQRLPESREKIDSAPQIDHFLVNNTIQIRYLGTTSRRDQQGGLQGPEAAQQGGSRESGVWAWRIGCLLRYSII
jgi:hypothetical protein